MSRLYEMQVVVHDYDPKKKEAIQLACSEEWEFEDFYSDSSDTEMEATGQSNLCGGESEEEFRDRLCHAIWKANDAYCEVIVNATYLEALPYETYTGGRKLYDQMFPGRKL